ncbi:MAG: EVE domain-containing protein [Desulfuromonadales bacterium]|nr:EVE domain-containing protein [Desulfuromonadales bacterium]
MQGKTGERGGRERRYWLFKSEPSTFSFDDLKGRPERTEHWDGVRNFQARNYLRQEIQVGDRLLFYHSSIPEPVIVGIAEVVRGGYPDWTSWDPESGHFDPRSTEAKPLWYMVDVRYLRPFPRPVTRSELKAIPELAGMVLLKKSRLSIQPVSEAEWRVILRLGGIEEG